MEFKERKTQPARDNKYYNKPKAFSSPDLDMWVLGGNCTDYAWCRYREAQQNMSGSKELPTSAADRWFKDAKAKGLKTGQVAKLGAVACFKNHVAMVEHLDGNKQTLSAGGFTKLKATRYLFKLKTIKVGGTWNGKEFYGYIYPPKDYDNSPKWEENKDYKVLFEKYLRTSPKVSATNKCKYNNLSSTAKAKCTKDKKGYAKYKVGAVINIKEFKTDAKGSIWGRTNTLWVCVNDSSGKQVIKV